MGSGRPSDAEPRSSIAYVLTHYPETALTFISREIEEIERLGWRVRRIAINVPSAIELDSSEAKAAAGTLYLKSQGPVRLAQAMLAIAIRNPVRMSRLVALAVGSARLDLLLVVRRLVHLAYACWAWKAIRHTDIRHFHAHFGQTPATIAWFAALVGELDSGEVCTWSFTIHGYQDFADERVTRLDLKVRSASFVVCISDFTRAQLYRATDPTAWERFHVVRCGIDVDTFPPRSTPPANDCLRILTVARLSAEKGHLILLESFRSLCALGLHAELRIVGDGPMASTISNLVEQYGLADRVVLVGALPPEQVALELSHADIFCLPSFAEGIPVSIMEAMAVGVPVVSTYVGGIPELAVDMQTALVVPAGNVDSLTSALLRLINDPGLRAFLTSAAQVVVRTRHSAQQNVSELAALFDIA